MAYGGLKNHSYNLPLDLRLKVKVVFSITLFGPILLMILFFTTFEASNIFPLAVDYLENGESIFLPNLAKIDLFAMLPRNMRLIPLYIGPVMDSLIITVICVNIESIAFKIVSMSKGSKIDANFTYYSINSVFSSKNYKEFPGSDWLGCPNIPQFFDAGGKYPIQLKKQQDMKLLHLEALHKLNFSGRKKYRKQEKLKSNFHPPRNPIASTDIFHGLYLSFWQDLHLFCKRSHCRLYLPSKSKILFYSLFVLKISYMQKQCSSFSPKSNFKSIDTKKLKIHDENGFNS